VANWQYCALTDQGVKRKHNEDAVVAAPAIGLWAVADGMGGHEAGDVASKMIVDALSAVVRPDNFSLFVDRVEDSLLAVNQAMRDHARHQFGGRMMGSTVVTILVADGYGACVWAGDSRLYRLRDGQLSQLSRDHSQVQRLVDAGLLSEADAQAHPDANVITRAIGGAASLVLDVILFDVLPNDRFLLCSDGLYNEVSAEDILTLLQLPAPDVCAQALVEASIRSGARDNVSVIVLQPESL
jgi:serine/threonine protein phosphatase PrpC